VLCSCTYIPYCYTVQAALQAENTVLQDKLHAVQKKLEWYMDNQQIVDTLTVKLKQQESTITALKQGSTS
jgi:hypothetical protein